MVILEGGFCSRVQVSGTITSKLSNQNLKNKNTEINGNSNIIQMMRNQNKQIKIFFALLLNNTVLSTCLVHSNGTLTLPSQ